jgi:CHASE2 domain-containing sensor protein
MFKRLLKAKAFGLRVLVCWIIGCVLPFFDEVDNYDLRFHLRGQQEANKEIVLVQLDQSDWTAIVGPTENWLRAVKEFTALNDSFFWRSAVWDQLLGKILAQNPKAIGVTFFFSQQLPLPDRLGLRLMFKGP